MKTCGTCETKKPLSAFNKNRHKKDGLQTECRECSKERSREYYEKNREKQIKQIYEAKLRRIEENRRFVFDYLSTHACVDCGESDPRVLEFDHQRDKQHNISSLLQDGYGKETIQKEIDKCEVRCANCHRRKTAIDFGWYTHRMFEEKNA
jgi:5-methylcytosine-specific restriction endonuclease McrA